MVKMFICYAATFIFCISFDFSLLHSFRINLCIDIFLFPFCGSEFSLLIYLYVGVIVQVREFFSLSEFWVEVQLAFTSEQLVETGNSIFSPA